jgi:multidrug efflux pump subunit AcrA (membrane-fusion protein)
MPKIPLRNIPFALTIAFALIGCGKKSTPVQAKNQAEIISVRATAAVERQTALELSLTGSFAAEFSAALAPEAEGIVLRTPVSVGDFVAQGAPVLELQPQTAKLRLSEAEAREREARAALAQAEARLGIGANGRLENVPEVLAAKAMLDSAETEERLMAIEATRADNLLKTGDVSRSTMDRATANLRMAEARTASARRNYDTALNQAKQGSSGIEGARAALETARSQTALARKALADTIVRAPFAGFVAARTVAPGEFVNNQTKFLTLDRIVPLKLEIQAPEGAVSQLQPGQSIKAIVQAYAAEEFLGTLTAISPSINPASRSFLAEARFANQDRRLKPGMFANVKVALGKSESRVVIPAAALEVDGRTESNRVWIVENGTARLRLVEVAVKNATEVELRSGLPAGAMVITSDRAKLFDGAPVQTNPNLR